MNDDTNWLKKNPTGNTFRRSLRSSRFYAQNMDGSIVTQREGSKDQVLPVSYVPRRSNIPMATIKEMNFKIPTLMKTKTGLKKPVTRISKPLISQDYTFRPSTLKSEHNRSGLMVKIQNGSAKNPKRGSCASNYLSSSPALKLNKMERKSKHSTKQKESGIKNFDDTSILSQSKIVNQSTPKEPTALRSILKQNQIQNGDTRKVFNGERPKAAKRVNFNGSEREDTSEKENEECPLRIPHPLPASPKKTSKQLESECNESPVLCNSFSMANEFLNNSNETSCNEEEKSLENPFRLKALIGMEKENQVSPESCYIFKVWKSYRERVNNIRTQMHSLDEEWRNELKLEITSGMGVKFSSYVQEKNRLYEELQKLEEEIKESFSDVANVKKLFLNYFDKKEHFLKEQAELEDNFEKTLRSFVTKRAEQGKMPKTDDMSGTPVKPGKYKSPKRRKSVYLGGVQKRAAIRKNICHDVAAGNDSLQSDTPTRQRELSTKIEKQIKTLFED